MTVRVLDEHAVRRLLPMGECIDAMGAALSALARGEVHNPLRSMTQPPGEESLMVLMPVRDDWSSAAELIRRIDKTISPHSCTMEILLVDDSSVERCEREDFQIGLSVVRAIRSLRLRRNLGHQRAIAIGLVHVQQSISCDAVVVLAHLPMPKHLP